MSLWSRIFGPKQPIDRRRWNEDWRAGDLAVCILVHRWKTDEASNPKHGDVLRVTKVYEGVSDTNARCYFLRFVGKPYGYDCTAFRKVRPDHKAADTEISRRIRACKPIRTRERA